MSTAPPPGRLSRQSDGWRARLAYLVHRLLQRLSGGRAALHAYLICAQPIGSGAYGALRADPNTVVRRLPAGDPLLADLPRPAPVLARRHASGADCYAAIVKGEFAGCIWIAHGVYDEDEVRCRFQLPDDRRSVWDFDVYVVPRYRNGRTLARLWQAVDADLQARGVRWTCSRISLYNLASLQTHERLGARELLSGYFLVLGRLQLAWLSERPRLTLSLSDGAAPRLQVPTPPAEAAPALP